MIFILQAYYFVSLTKTIGCDFKLFVSLANII